MQRFSFFKTDTRPSADLKKEHLSDLGPNSAEPDMMPGQIPDPSLTAGSLPSLGPLAGIPSTTLTAEDLKYADMRNIEAMISPLHFLGVKLSKRPSSLKGEVSTHPGWVGCDSVERIGERCEAERRAACLPRTAHTVFRS
ncbi:JDP2 protein, partial [Polyodon spathula]|nr:JDP2 protein [Polyodon spathula]